MLEEDYWVVRSAHTDRHAAKFNSEAEALRFAETGDVLAHLVNGQEVHHRPVVK
jgi:hypothetical protein